MLFMSLDSWYSLLGFCDKPTFLKIIHGHLMVHGLTENLLFATKLVSLYGSFGDIGEARTLFDRIENPDLYCWKVMLRWYFLNDSYPEVIRFYMCMRQCFTEHDNVIFSIILKASSELRDLNEGRKLHCLIFKVGSPDSFVSTGLIDMYAKCGTIEFARDVFNEITEKDVVSWTSMIAGYVQNDCAEEGLNLFNERRWILVEPNEFTVGILLYACLKLGALHQGKWVHGYIIKIGVSFNSLLGTSLLDMYVKCGNISDARCVFNELPAVDLVSWTAMILGYTQRGHPSEAMELFTEKKWETMVPNSVTITGLLSACSQLRNVKMGRVVHLLAIQFGLVEDAIVRNALVDMYAKCGMVGYANFIFSSNLSEDVVPWNSMIGGFALNGYAIEALSWFHRLRSSSTLPDAVTLVNVISACAHLGALPISSSFHGYAAKSGFLSNIYVGTALLNLYAKCGDVESARRVFNEMYKKNTVTWSAMVGGYGMQGDSGGSLALFTEMLKENLLPNDITFMNILAACSHTGMVDEGLGYFNGMCQLYNVVPRMKHYVCMVDLLARAGRLEDALKFIMKMPIEADVSIWGAFLHGCRIHSRLEVGEVAVNRILELYPENPGYYVLISNFYASDGRWDQAGKVRDLMKRKGLNKQPGCSSVEMDDAPYSSLQLLAVS
ncbi:pentatricopeptide repeat-containing protein At2g03380, mitochondrial [Aristolochia californica]|uniref:pentatricopeptide repeat-containing protein At2g03380, mitochondrial n=1 Tax=Aristolochia californica TaxID=171875 RepID=UPI0035D90047